MPNLGGLGACPPRNFEKLSPLRLNLRAFLIVYSLYYSKIAQCTIISPDKKYPNKRLWLYIKGQRRKYSGIPTINANGLTLSEDSAKANALNAQFASVFTREDTSAIPNLSGTTYPTMRPISVTVEGVASLLSNLDPCKVSGPDGIPARFLKDMANDLAPLLTLIYQASLQQGCIPDEWKKALITPIYKNGDRSCPANYRPISLTCIVCKTLEHIISTSIYNHLEEYTILYPEQHGFRRRRSCETQLISTIYDFATALNNAEQVDVILLDLSKAFDNVPHIRLCHKLSYYGIVGYTLEWIENFLSGRPQQVILNGEHSESCPVLSGVPQGSVLGPLLFLCYLNDLPAQVKSSIKLYADDASVYRRIHSKTYQDNLQEDLAQWAATWQMSFNVQKCMYLRITNKLHCTSVCP